MATTGKKRTRPDCDTKARKRRIKLIELFGGSCNECDVIMPDYVYEFHHINPKNKLFTLSGHDLNRKWEIVLAEADKCEMLCANCHKMRHGELMRHGSD